MSVNLVTCTENFHWGSGVYRASLKGVGFKSLEFFCFKYCEGLRIVELFFEFSSLSSSRCETAKLSTAVVVVIAVIRYLLVVVRS